MAEQPPTMTDPLPLLPALPPPSVSSNLPPVQVIPPPPLLIPPVPGTSGLLPVPPPTSGIDHAVGALEVGSGIGRRGFWLFAGVCWIAALIPWCGPINHLHTLGSGREPSAAGHAYLAVLLHLLTEILPAGVVPSLPTRVVDDPLGLILVMAVAMAPLLMIAAVWPRTPVVPVAAVRWLGLVPLLALLLGCTLLHWSAGTVTFANGHDVEGLLQRSVGAKGVLGAIDDQVRLQAWIQSNGGTSHASRVLGHGDLLLIRQPLGWIWLTILGIAAGIGTCWAIARPLGVALGSLCPPSGSSIPRTSAAPALAVIILTGLGSLMWSVLGDGRTVLAERMAARDAAWKREEADRVNAQAAATQREAAERERTRIAEQERVAAEIERMRQRNADDDQRRTQARETAAARSAAQVAADAEQRERAQAEAVERERKDAVVRVAAAEVERLASAERQRQAAAERQQRIEAWTARRDDLLALPRQTLAEVDRALVDVDLLADAARRADATAELTTIHQRMVTERAALVTLQEQRLTIIRAIFRNTEYRRIPEARQALEQYLAASGDRTPIAAQAARLASPTPWALERGEDAAGLWADLDAGKVNIRLRRLPVLQGQPERWLGERELPAVDLLTLIPGRAAVLGSSTGLPATAVTLADARRACEVLSTLTTMRIRLPTVAEWTQAQSGGDHVAVPADAQLRDLAWYADTAGGHVHESGGRTANQWGFHDLLGNVAEWAVPVEGAPVLLGGSWKSQVWDLGDPQTPDIALLPTAGFRILLAP